MIELTVYNLKGKKVDTFQLDEEQLGGEVRFALLKQAYVRQHANRRQGSARTRSRGMVTGSTRKIYRQKGTGNARMGTVRSNIRKGGGVTFAKTRTRQDYHQSMPKKMRRLANRNALLAKAVDQEIKIIDSLDLDRPRTKAVQALLEAVGVNRTCLVALDGSNMNTALSARNLDDVDTIRWDQLNVFDLLNHRFLVIDRDSLQKFVDGAYMTGSGGNNGAAADAEAGTSKEVA
ncbi:MAG: 50S ribosomal protein L4 [Planctomycetes bacterium]|nr:50S ribosomal protein L4 [Planctomycetota bacterium]NOG54830.1 50S ribosomal protein L4 [Planctomycetota bacterium]